MQSTHYNTKILFVRFLFFCVMAFELPKFPYIFTSCNNKEETYHLIPQFLGTIASKSSPYWILLHSIMINLLVVIIGLKMLGYEIRHRTFLALAIINELLILANVNHFGNAPAMVATFLNLIVVLALSFLYVYRMPFAFVVAFSAPLWVFNVPAFFYYLYQLFTGKFDSKFTLFVIQFLTSNTFYPAYLKMAVFLISAAGMLAGTYVFVTIPEKKTD